MTELEELLTRGPIAAMDVLRYEIRASWWYSLLAYLPPPLGSPNWVARYFAWKVNRKYRRYIASFDELQRVVTRQREKELK